MSPSWVPAPPGPLRGWLFQTLRSARGQCGKAHGKTVETVEGLADGQTLHPLQQAFLEETGMQCGICTPGFLMASKALLNENPNPTEAEIRHWLAGNLCRCTGYKKIFDAVEDAAQVAREEGVAK